MDEGGTARTRRGHNRAMLDAAYEKYAARLYDYCLWSTGDAEIAEDAVHSALVAAFGRDGLLRHDTTLRPWLYTAARNECIRAFRKSGRQPKPLTGVPGVEDPTAKITALEELARVRRVTASFTRHEQDVAELALRHRLVPTEVGIVLGRPQAHVRTVILRVHSALSARCGEGVLLAFSSPPPPPVPEALYARIRGSASIAERAAYFAERAGPYTRAGFPVAIDRPRTRVRTIAIASSAVAVVTVIALAIALTQAGSPDGPGDQPPSTQPPLAVGPTFDPDGESDPPDSSPQPSPTPSEAEPSATAPRTGTGATPEIRLSFKSSTGCPPTWTAQITAVVDGNLAREVRVAWWTSKQTERQIAAAAISDNRFLTSISGLPYGTEVFFRATATTVDSRTGQTGAYPVTAHCQ